MLCPGAPQLTDSAWARACCALACSSQRKTPQLSPANSSRTNPKQWRSISGCGCALLRGRRGQQFWSPSSELHLLAKSGQVYLVFRIKPLYFCLVLHVWSTWTRWNGLIASYLLRYVIQVDTGITSLLPHRFISWWLLPSPDLRSALPNFLQSCTETWQQLPSPNSLDFSLQKIY